ncbi:MAG TPA: polysaccharide biosynthesis C-terminal domain-containing protein [Chitinophagaceae bacterium]|nr:MAG: polysaccharide biosynthesis protein [Bacteroidetes bacterium OLB11]HMN32339.1 polysaccharide biosynthesis C-terminal domain-containing protein [Chitinophagaceae bacterium]
MSIKKLAGQTIWYGIPSIATRFLGYILNFSLIYLYKAVDTADITQIYAIFPFLNILFTYGLETSYFKFAQQEDKSKVYNTLSISILLSTIFLTIALLALKEPIIKMTAMEMHPEFVTYMAIIVFLDTLNALPFAKLRQEERPRKYALIKFLGILINVLFVIWYLGVCPNIARNNPDSFLLFGYRENIGIAYYLIGGIVGSGVTLLMLLPQLLCIQFQFDKEIWKQVMVYTFPLIIVGLGGMINDMLSRLVFQQVSPLPALEAKHELGVFAANYRLAVLMTIFIQMFRLAAEPFFFNHSKNKNAPETYANIMFYFVLASCCMFLGISLFLDVFKVIMTLKYKEYGEGIEIVPILTMGGVFLGIYYNLSIWYKLTNKNWYGAAITLGGALITIILNVLWIPKYSYVGSAWATFICYLFMMITSYYFGQKHYPIPYQVSKILKYIILSTLIAILSQFIGSYIPSLWVKIIINLFLFFTFILTVLIIDKDKFSTLPVIGKYIK